MAKERKITIRRFDVDAIDFITSEFVQMMDSSEVGQYWLLLCHSWISEKDATLPDDPAYLARLIRVTEVSKLVLDRFDKVETEWGPRLRNERMYEEWLSAKYRIGIARENANKRWRPDGSDMGRQCPGNAPAMLLTNTNTKEQNNTSNELDLSPAETSKADNGNSILEIWHYYIAEIGKNAALYTLTPSRRSMGLKRFAEALNKVVPKGDTDKAIFLMKCAIDALRDSAFHQGKNDSKKKYLDWELLFRSPDQFEKWLERADQ